MKLYAKIKVDGKWTMVPAGTVKARLEAHYECECRVCSVVDKGFDALVEEE